MDILNEVRFRFINQIKQKNSWGKNEIEKLLNDTIIKVLFENLKINHIKNGNSKQ